MIEDCYLSLDIKHFQDMSITSEELSESTTMRNEEHHQVIKYAEGPHNSMVNAKTRKPVVGIVTDTSLAARKKIERRLVLKQDFTIIPLLALCFFFSYVVSLEPDSGRLTFSLLRKSNKNFIEYRIGAKSAMLD